MCGRIDSPSMFGRLVGFLPPHQKSPSSATIVRR
jgi:hypothetical protein